MNSKLWLNKTNKNQTETIQALESVQA